MGNALAAAQSGRPRDAADLWEEDQKWLETTAAAMLNDEFISESLDQLGGALESNSATPEEPQMSAAACLRMLQLYSSASEHPVTHVEDFPALSPAKALAGPYGSSAKGRARVLLRVHAALLRQRARLAGELPGPGGAGMAGGAAAGAFAMDPASEQVLETDPSAILTGASIRMSLVMMKALRRTSPELFREMAQSLVELLGGAAPFALSSVPSVACRDSLRALRAFAVEVASGGGAPAATGGTGVAIDGPAERAEAVALLLALAVACGSLGDVTTVAACLLAPGAPPLPTSAAAPLAALMAHRRPLALSMPLPEAAAGSFAARLEGDRPDAVLAATALATDGVYLYVWEAGPATPALLKIGTGFHGTVAGVVYARNSEILAQVRVAKGLAAESVDGEAAGTATPPPGDSGGSGAPRRFRALHPTFMYDEALRDLPEDVDLDEEVLFDFRTARLAEDEEGNVLDEQMINGTLFYFVSAIADEDGSELQGWVPLEGKYAGNFSDEEDEEDEESSSSGDSEGHYGQLVEIFDAESGEVLEPTSLLMATGGSAGAGAAGPSWLAVINGRIYFRERASGALEGGEMAVLRCLDLSFDSVAVLPASVAISGLVGGAADSSRDGRNSSATDNGAESAALGPSGGAGGGDNGVAAAAAAQPLPPVNYATAERGAAVTEFSRGTLAEEERDLAIVTSALLSDEEPDGDGITFDRDDGERSLEITFSPPADVTDIRLLFKTEFIEGLAVTAEFIWSTETAPALHTKVEHTLDSADLEAESWATPVGEDQAGAVLRSVRSLRLSFEVAERELGQPVILSLRRVLVLGPAAPPPEPAKPFPAVTTDGRHLFVVHSQEGRPAATAVAGAAPATPECDLFVYTLDPEADMALLAVAKLEGVPEAVLHGSAIATNGEQLLLLGPKAGAVCGRLAGASPIHLRCQVSAPLYIDVREATAAAAGGGGGSGGGGSGGGGSGGGGADVGGGKDSAAGVAVRTCAWEEEQQLAFPTRSTSPAVPHGLAYDSRNNMLWAWDPICSRLSRWRNAGPPPARAPPRPAAAVVAPGSAAAAAALLASPSPSHRLEGLAALGGISSGGVGSGGSAGSGDYGGAAGGGGGSSGAGSGGGGGNNGRPAVKATTAAVEAARLLCQLDRLCEVYAPPVEPQAEARMAGELEASGAGADGDDASRLAIGGVDHSLHRPGVNVLVLDYGMAVWEVRHFPTHATEAATEHLAEYLLHDVPAGRTVLLATEGAAADGLSKEHAAAIQRALVHLGADREQLAKLSSRDAMALIGCAGGRPGSAVLSLRPRREGAAVAKLRLPAVRVPLAVDPSPETLQSILALVMAGEAALLRAVGAAAPGAEETHGSGNGRGGGDGGDAPTPEQVVALSAIRVLTVQVHRLLNGSPLPKVAAAFSAEQRAALLRLLLAVLDRPAAAAAAATPAVSAVTAAAELTVTGVTSPETTVKTVSPAGAWVAASLLAATVSDAALRLFMTMLDVFYPSSAERCSLLVGYLAKYAAAGPEALSPFERSVLELLLRRLSDPTELGALQQAGAATAGTTPGTAVTGPSSVTADGSGSGKSSPAGETPAVSAPMDLLEKLLEVAAAEGCKGMALQKAATARKLSAVSGSTAVSGDEAGTLGIGAAATATLSTLLRQLISESCQAAGGTLQEGAAAPGDPAGAAASPAAATMRERGNKLLQELYSRVCGCCARLLDAATAAGGSGGSSGGGSAAELLPASVDRTLEGGPVGVLLPLLVAATTALLGTEGAAPLSCSQAVAESLAPVMARVAELLRRVPAEKRVLATGSSGPKARAPQDFESLHPYADNTNETVEVSFPGATRILVSFDARSRTENGYDHVIFWKDAERTERWHEEEKFCGRDGSENFPGFGGRPALLIEGDRAFVSWVSDGSNVDWGWRFTATPEYKRGGRGGSGTSGGSGSAAVHWLAELDHHCAAAMTAVATSLITQDCWAGAAEDEHAPWLEDPLLALNARASGGGIGGGLELREVILSLSLPTTAVSSPDAGDAGAASGKGRNALEEASAAAEAKAAAARGAEKDAAAGTKDSGSKEAVLLLLSQVLEYEEKPATEGWELCRAMRAAVREDQGAIAPINSAVRATAAALIWHMGLGADALAVARGKVKLPSKALVKAWKMAQKMRSFFALGDVRDAIEREREAQYKAAAAAAVPAVPEGVPPVPILARGPSVYEGAEERVVEQVGGAVVARAQFLLSLPSQATAADRAAAAKRRWANIAKAGAAADGLQTPSPGERSESPSPPRDRWDALVGGVPAKAQLQAALAWRRKAAEHRSNAKELGVGERVLRFLQSRVDPQELLATRALRNKRAICRAEGLRVARQAVAAAGSAPAKVWVLSGVGAALRGARRPGQPEPKAHYRNCVEGCDPAAHEALVQEFALLLGACLQALADCRAGPAAAVTAGGSGSGSGTDASPPLPANVAAALAAQRDALAAAALQACALDYDVADHELLEGSGLVAAIEPLLRTSSIVAAGANTEGDAARAAAWALLEALLPRCVGLEGQRPEETAAMEEPTELSKQLMMLLIRLAQRVAENVTAASRALEPPAPQRQRGYAAAHAAATAGTVLLPGGVRLRRDEVGLVAPHQPLGLRHCVSFWLRREKTRLDDEVAAGRPARPRNLRAGDTVVRGADWCNGDDDGGPGCFGTVSQIRGVEVTVVWEATAKRTLCSFGGTGDGRPRYEILAVEDAAGGTLFQKGGRLNLPLKQREEPWSLLGLELLWDSTLRFSAVSGPGGQTFQLRGNRRLRPKRWEHVALVTDGLNCCLYVDGEKDAEAELDASLATQAAADLNVNVETPHPYPDNCERFWEVAVPGAISYQVLTDRRTATEQGYDYVTFQMERGSNEYHGESRYSGGRENSPSNWPGMDARAPLVINAPKFTVYFHSDGSTNAWGFKFTIVPILGPEALAAAAAANNAAPRALNELPFYLGAAPPYVDTHRAAEGYMAGFAVHTSDLAPERIKAMAAAPPPGEPVALDESGALDVLGLLHRTVRSSGAQALLWTAGTHPLASPAVLSPLLTLLARGPLTVRVAAARLCCILVPQALPEVVDVQAQALGLFCGHSELFGGIRNADGSENTDGGGGKARKKADGGSGSTEEDSDRGGCFLRYLLAAVGRTLSVWTPRQSGAAAAAGRKERGARGSGGGGGRADKGQAAAATSSENAFAMAAAHLEILRALAAHPEWSPAVFSLLEESWLAVPLLVAELQASARVPSGEASAAAVAPGKEPMLWAAHAGLAVLGGVFEGLVVGGSALCLLGRGDGASLERCTILGLDWPQAHALEAKKAAAAAAAGSGSTESAAQRADAKAWEGLNAFGDALWVSLESDPEVAVVTPRTRLSPASATPSPGFVAALAERAARPTLVAAFRALLEATDVDPRPPRLPITAEEDKVIVVESPHPVGSWTIEATLHFEGAKEMKISFDPNTRATSETTTVTFYKDETLQTKLDDAEFAGGEEAKWPGVNGQLPLLITAGTCIAVIRKDGGEEWGFRITASAHCVRTVLPPDIVPSPALAALAALRAHGARALESLVAMSSAAFTAEVLPLFKPLVAAACVGGGGDGSAAEALGAGQSKGSGGKAAAAATPLRERQMVLESNHPYDNNSDARKTVHMIGAKRLLISFDSQTRTELNCDYMTFYRDSDMRDVIGELKYSGGREGGPCNWPGMQGRPPLEIPGPCFTYRFISDGSVNDWGWKMTVTAVLSQLDPATMATPVLRSRIHHLSCLLRDGPRPQQQAKGLEDFPVAAAAASAPASAASSPQRRRRSRETASAAAAALLKKGSAAPPLPATAAAAWPAPATPAAAAVVLNSLREVGVNLALAAAAGVAAGDEVAMAAARAEAAAAIRASAPRASPAEVLARVDEVLAAATEGLTAAAIYPRRFVVNPQAADGFMIPVNAAPSSDAPLLATLGRLQAVTVVAEQGHWLQIRLPGEPEDETAKTGWVVWRRDDREDVEVLVPVELVGSRMDVYSGPPLEDEQDEEEEDKEGGNGGGGGSGAAAVLPPAYAVADPAGDDRRGPAGAGAFDVSAAEAMTDSSPRLWTALTECARAATARSAQAVVAAMLTAWPAAAAAAAATADDGGTEGAMTFYPGAIDSPDMLLMLLRWLFVEAGGVAGAPAPDGGGSGGSGADASCGGRDRAALEAARSRLLECVRAGGDAVSAVVPSLAKFGLEQLQLATWLRSGLPEVRGILKVLETDHPHQANQSQEWKVKMDGALRLLLSCDKRSDAAAGAQMTIYRGPEKSAYWGRPSYSGQSWPGLNGVPPVAVQGGSCLVVFRAEQENSESKWGFKMNVFFVLSEPSAEQRDALRAERRGVGKPQVGLACYLMDMLCREPDPSTRGAVCGPVALAALRRHLETAPPAEQLAATRLLTSVLQGLRPTVAAGAAQASAATAAAALSAPASPMAGAGAADVLSSAESIVEVRLLAATLRGLTATNVKAEESRGPAPRSPLLQALVQAGVAMENYLRRGGGGGSGGGSAAASSAAAAGPSGGFGVPAAALPAWHENLQTLLELLAAFVARGVPQTLVAEQFLPQCQTRAGVLLESVHPFDGAARSQVVSVPGATALEVRFDAQTIMDPKDVIRIRSGSYGRNGGGNGGNGGGNGSGPEERVFLGLEGGTDAVAVDRGLGIAVGDVVSRGPDWCWGSTDGGAGSLGDVVAVGLPWLSKPEAAVRVAWRSGSGGAEGLTSLYRWDPQGGTLDLTVRGTGPKCTAPAVVAGSSLTFVVEPAPPLFRRADSTGFGDDDGAGDDGDGVGISISGGGAEGGARAATAVASGGGDGGGDGGGGGSGGSGGGLVLNAGESGFATLVTAPAATLLELEGDFTAEIWVRLQGEGFGGVTGALAGCYPVMSRGMRFDDQCISQFELSVVGNEVNGSEGVVRLTMGNVALATAVNLSGGAVQPGVWTHLAFSLEGPTARLLVDGNEVASGAFSGERVALGHYDVIIGRQVGGGGGNERFRGNVADLRFWSCARSAADIAAGKNRLPARGAAGLLVNFPLTEGPAEAPRNRGTAAAAVVTLGEGCAWDTAVTMPHAPAVARWGYKARVVPRFPLEQLPHMEAFKEEYAAFAAPYQAGTMRHDLALVRHVNALTRRKGMDLAQLLRANWSDVTPTDADMVRDPLLKELVEMETAGGGSGAMQPAPARFQLLQMLNRRVRDALPFVDLSQADKPASAAARLLRCRGIVFRAVKDPMWDAALAATAHAGGEPFELRLNRPRAMRRIAMGDVDAEGHWSVFAQAYRAMGSMHPRFLRSAGKLYNCLFLGERSQDAGGPYRESFATYCAELQSPALPLLVRTPNALHAAGAGRDRWLLSPGAASAAHLGMLRFLGRLMGHAARSKEYLNLSLSPLVWKALVGQEATREDLEGVDVQMLRSMESMRTIDQQVTEAMFADTIFESFVTTSLDGRRVELRPGGADEPVTWANRHEFADLVERHRLTESGKQAAAVREGLGEVLPLRTLALFGWDELELAVCGRPEVDIRLLESVTEYSGCRADDEHVRYFWAAMNEFTAEERSRFIQFVWGRTRLPLTAADFSQRFKIQNFTRNPPDSYLPVSHTCFFSIELPRYSSLELMMEKLRYAVFNCQAIDTDDTDTGLRAAAMGWED